MFQHSRNLQVHFVFFIELSSIGILLFRFTHSLNILMGQK